MQCSLFQTGGKPLLHPLGAWVWLPGEGGTHSRSRGLWGLIQSISAESPSVLNLGVLLAGAAEMLWSNQMALCRWDVVCWASVRHRTNGPGQVLESPGSLGLVFFLATLALFLHYLKDTSW